MQNKYHEILQLILSNYDTDDSETRKDLSSKVLAKYGRLLDSIPFRDEAYLSAEDQVVNDLISRLPKSPQWKMEFFKNAHVVLVRLNAIFVLLCAAALIFTVYITRLFSANLVTTLVGAGTCLVFLALFLLTRWANHRYVDFLYSFLKDGDLPWFFATNLFIFDLTSRNTKGKVANHSLESRRTNLSTLFIKKFAATFDENRNYKTQKLLLYYCAFEEIQRRDAAVHESTSDAELRILILTKVLAFSKESSLISFQLGMEHLGIEDYKKATFFFSQASGSERNNLLFEGYYFLARYLEEVL